MVEEEPKLTGLAKHFNSVTNTGRANVSIVTSKSSRTAMFEHNLQNFFYLSHVIYYLFFNFAGSEGYAWHYRTNSPILLHETEETKGVIKREDSHVT